MSEIKLEEVKKETVKPSKSVSKPAVKPVSKGAAESSDVILRLENLSKTFGKNRVLSGISLEVKRGHVLGLMGENGAGKSTMMKCLFGIYSRDEGEIYLDGKLVSFSGPKEALEHGVAMVHQELNQCIDRSVADNMFLGRFPTKFGMIDEAKMKLECNKLFRSLGMNVNPSTIMRTMSVSQRQMVEIAKAVSYNAKVIVLDEPTSSLSEREVKKLFDIINTLRVKGVSFIFISHKMDELFRICNDMAVLRDGHMIFEKPIKDTNMKEVVAAMVGRSLDQRFPPLTNHPGKPVLEVDNLSTKYEPFLKNITFSVRKGEIFGIYGLVGAGRSELLESIFGLRKLSTGKITYAGQRVEFHSSADAMNYNFALVTEERRKNGIFAVETLTFNTAIANLDHYKRFGYLNNKMMDDAAKKEIKAMHTKCMGTDDKMGALSGGNQQKVVLGKWMERNPDVFLLDEPTRGIDVMAKYQIYELINKMATAGKTILVVSSEMPEILGITNRIAVLSNHQLAGIVETKKTNQEELLTLCAKCL
jgi:methyl-galactoside transport system ATP-binding protein